MKIKRSLLTFLCFLICFFICTLHISVFSVYAGNPTAGPDLQSASAVLMEAETGQIIFAKDENTRRSPASVTKVMTLILIFDQLHDKSISLNDPVTTSAHAKSMGGSQVFLEEGEIQTVETLIKCIVIASGNDASVAMAEFISGTEEEFVNQMNLRASALGMNNTHFTDCCGLTDSDDHYTTAADIALMSRELITKYPEILDYSSIWMENILHETKQGTKEFHYLSTDGNKVTDVSRKLQLPEHAEAPVKKGEKAGEVIYSCDGKELGRISVLYKESVRSLKYADCLRKAIHAFCL